MNDVASEHYASARPRVLFLTQVLPYPLDAGPKVRAYHVLRALAQSADVHLLSFVRQDDPPDALAHLRTICASVETVPMRRSRLPALIKHKSLAPE